MKPNTTQKREILTVSELNRRARSLLENEFRQIWVEGEISNLVKPASGHWYFTLKDSNAQVKCAMFANRNRGLRLPVSNGMQVIVRAKASLYEGRGDYQLIAENLLEAGEGLLQRQFEQLKNKLASEGLFDEAYKQPLPTLPSHIGIITSPSGAAIRDILTVLARRFPSIPVSLIPTRVQGKQASAEIVTALKLANQARNLSPPIDALIIGRGGGALEDLWPFNEEAVARAIFNSQIPIVSAVGHEIDFTISDFVADERAPTPSAAAELLSPDRQQWQTKLSKAGGALNTQLQRRLQQSKHRLDHLAKRLRHPGQQLQEQAQRLDDIESRLKAAMTHKLSLQQAHLAARCASLSRYQPRHQITQLSLTRQQLSQRLHGALTASLEKKQQQLQHNAHTLHTLSPLQTLGRGYAIIKDQQQRIIRNSEQIEVGDSISAQLGKGKLYCTVDNIE